MMTTEQVIDDRGVTAVDGTTKARIERAALSLFVEHGVDATTTREIAAASGVAEGTLYRHFKSKDEIAETLFFTIHHRFTDLIMEIGAQSTHITKQTANIVEALCQFADDDRTLFNFHLLYTHQYLPRRNDESNPVSAIESLLSAAMARGELDEGDAKLSGAMVLGPVLQTALHIAYGRLPPPMTTYAPDLTAAVIRILSPKEGNTHVS